MDKKIVKSGDKPFKSSSNPDQPRKNSLAEKIRMERRRAAGTWTIPVVKLEDPYETTIESKNRIRGSTGLINNLKISNSHRCLWDFSYPEKPERAQSVFDRLQYYGLIERCVPLKTRVVTPEEVGYAHLKEMYFLLKTICVPDICPENFELFSSRFDAIFINENTFLSAVTAAGSSIELIENIVKNEIQNGMAVIRPPGHHAMNSEYNGYCFFNNAAVAAEHAIRKLNLSRVMIVDIDVHHGQGVQQQFIDSNKVLYMSIHRYENGTFWPNLRQSDFDCVGSGIGEGYNFNIPLNETGMTDSDYLSIFHQIILPVGYEYKPELVILCAGYDAAIGCPEGEMLVTPQGYAHMTHMLQLLANGRLAVILEGGYGLEFLAEGAAMTLKALLDDPVPILPMVTPPKTSLMESVSNCIAYHKKYWKCFSGFKCEIPETVPHECIVSSPGKPKQYETRDCYPIAAPIPSDIKDQVYKTLPKPNEGLIPKLLILYDPLMLLHKHRDDLTQPECASRISMSYELLDEFGLLERSIVKKGTSLTLEELQNVHTKRYINELNEVIENKKDDLYTSIYTNEDTLKCALMAAGTSIEAVNQIVGSHCRSAIALIRPPGHHAEPDTTKGFCIFNNVAFAATHALRQKYFKKILIVDFDIHHPNGTYEVFKDNKDVLLISVHRYGSNFFPGTGSISEVGEEDGKGFNVNIPWIQKGQSDVEYIAAFNRVIMPIATQFNPDVVLVSAGFDAAVGDPLGHCDVTPEAYGHMVHMLKSLASGKIILFLEGGYNITSLTHSIVICAKTLLGDPLPVINKTFLPLARSDDVLNKVINIQNEFWNGLKLPEFNLNQVLARPTVVSKFNSESDLLQNLQINDFQDEDAPVIFKDHCGHVTGEFNYDEKFLLRSFAKVSLTPKKNWLCLQCFEVFSFDEVRGLHAADLNHPLMINLTTLAVYCFKCSSYIKADKTLNSLRNYLFNAKYN